MKRFLPALLFALPCLAAGPSGVVINQTTGEPAPRVAMTLISFAEGMDPIEEVYTDTDGRFAFAKEVQGAGMLRTDHEGVTYSTMVRPGAMSDLQVPIYDAAATPRIAPTGRILILEPGQAEMVVNESYLFENQGNKTYRDADNGSLQFYLPAEAKGVVQVQASGPARMPLNAQAEPTGEGDLYKVDFPIKPGENRISLSYLVPHQDGGVLAVRSPYEGVQTRVAAPAGVAIEGDGLIAMGQEPTTGTSIYEVPQGDNFEITLSGQGRLPRNEAAAGASSGGGAAGTSAPTEISIEQAPIAKEIGWIAGLTAAILALGFFVLATNRRG